jgi:tetratricopeptide (TPR) repeat protein
MQALSPIRTSLALLASLAVALGSSVAHAADNKSSASSSNASNVAQLNEEGATLYAARDYRRAIEKFIQAYAIDTDPNLLFNIARCYEELGEVDAAIEKYEVFLKTPGADTRGRQRARESLASLREARDQPKPAPDAAPSHAKSSTAVETSAEASSANPHDTAETRSVLPWVTLGGSILFAAAGTTFYLLGASDHSEVTDARGYNDDSGVLQMTRREADDLVSSGDTKKLIGGISFGLAGALAATYVVLLVTGEEHSSEPEPGPSLGFSLAPSPGGSSVMVQGSF